MREDDEEMLADGSFESVLAAAREGTAWAWERLVRGYEQRLVGFFRARGASDPEDLAGEVWLEVARRIDTFEGPEPGFRAWLFVIAYRRMVDERRRRARRPEVPWSREALDGREGARSAEDEALERLGWADLGRFLRVLTVAQRDVLVLRVIAGLSVAETAQVVGRSPGAVRVLQRRAVLALRKEISKQGVTK